MNKKEARIEALRIATGMINAGINLEDEFHEADAEKIYAALQDVADQLEKKATRLGGDFNPLTGYEHGKVIIINPP